jgi:hypothetical protein
MGNPISLFQTKPAEAKKPAKKGGNKQMAYLLATIGNPVSLFQTKPAEAKKPTKKRGNKQMAYLSATIETIV